MYFQHIAGRLRLKNIFHKIIYNDISIDSSPLHFIKNKSVRAFLNFLFISITIARISSAQRPGDLDVTFDVDGKKTIAIGTNSVAQALAVQGDDKILVAGFGINGGQNDFGMIRLLPDGALDNTFGNS